MIARAVALSVAALGLMAQSPEDLPSTFTIDAPQGKFSGWDDAVDDFVALRARVTVLKLGPYGEWLPGINVSIDADQRIVALKAYSGEEGWPLDVYAQLGVDDEEVGATPFNTVLDPAQPFDLELRWSKDGHVCMSITQSGHSESRMVSLGAPPAIMSLYGSGGSFQFSAIEQIELPAGEDRESADNALKAGCAPIS